ncbi:E3 ubiquitin-protein ligase RMA1H1-like [Curcuma longa]|uniref:E3 ubiquitin-protein ligase RMA1H1-like n=1 Tax=Curcuma longa TaxID=136217 RepID=UPI003D9E4D72
MEKSQAHNRSDGTAPVTAMTGRFDCNICLDLVVDPVVTLCGHLYCWPCIYKWMQVESMSHRQCPVCKAFLSRDTIVPLFGRGRDSSPKVAQGIPHRPAINFNHDSTASNLTQQSQFQQQQQQHQHHQHHLNDSIAYVDSSLLTTGIGGLAFWILPWLHSRRYVLTLSGNNPRLQRQELQVESSLHQIWVFLFFCAVVCLLVF